MTKKEHKTVKDLEKNSFEALKGGFGYKNVMQSPRLVKVILNVGIGSAKDKKRVGEIVPDRLAKISGQKASPRPAKVSIANFKTRQGDIIGYTVTLRGPRMLGFLEKLLNVALPRTRDFRGISSKSVDEIGNISFAVREHTVFPETSDEELRDVFGIGITVVTTAKNRKEASAFLKHLGFPLSDVLERKEKRKKRVRAKKKEEVLVA